MSAPALPNAGDHFERLGLPRRAWLEEEEIRASFQKAASVVHPDHSSSDADRSSRTNAFQELQQAAAALSAVSGRLRHLLELEAPGLEYPRSVTMDETMAGLFTRTAAAVQSAADWARQYRQAGSFLAKAALMPEAAEVQEQLESCTAALSAESAQQQARLRKWDQRQGDPEGEATVSALIKDDASFLLEESQRAAFLTKWKASVQAAWTEIGAAMTGA